MLSLHFLHDLVLFLFSRFVYVWDSVTQRILYRLPGHLGSINDVDFHPNEPISKSPDLTRHPNVRWGEVKSVRSDFCLLRYYNYPLV